MIEEVFEDKPSELFEDYVNFRFGNIGFDYINKQYEILKWQPNPYYGKEEDYELIKLNPVSVKVTEEDVYGYTPKGEHYGAFIVDKSCFENPETCYVLSTFTIDDEGPNLVWCGERPLNLDKREWSNFMKCVKLAYNYIRQITNNGDE
jgi:hypothetical protein